MKDLNTNYPHKLRVGQNHRWLKRAEKQNDTAEQEKIKLHMELLGIIFDENHPEYLKKDP